MYQKQVKLKENFIPLIKLEELVSSSQCGCKTKNRERDPLFQRRVKS